MATRARKGKRKGKPSGGLTPRQQIFVREYLVDLCGTQAAVRAGYSPKTAESQGSRLLRNAKVAAEIDRLKQERAKRVEVSADEVILGLKRIGLADIRQAFDADGNLKPVSELPDDLALALAGVEVKELFDNAGNLVGYTKKLKLSDRNRALENLGKHLKLFTEVHEHKVSLADLVMASLNGGDGA